MPPQEPTTAVCVRLYLVTEKTVTIFFHQKKKIVSIVAVAMTATAIVVIKLNATKVRILKKKKIDSGGPMTANVY